MADESLYRKNRSKLAKVADKPTHILRVQYKFLQSPYLGKLQEKVNEFVVKNNAESVTLTTGEVCQKGMMLCDRPNPNGDYYTLYIANIKYIEDYTARRMSEELDKWLESRLKEYSEQHIGMLPPLGLRSVETGRVISHEDLVRNYAEKLMASEEYKAVERELEIKYSEKPSAEK